MSDIPVIESGSSGSAGGGLGATSGSSSASNSEIAGAIVPIQAPKKRPATGKPFKKNGENGEKDPRINRYGRPKTFEAARKMMLKLLNETITGTNPSTHQTMEMARVELIMRDWITSANFQKQKAALEWAYGKMPEGVTMNIDLRTLTSEQLERIAKGEDVVHVLTHPQ